MNSNKKSTFVFPQCESHTIIDNGIEYSNCILTIVTEFNILNGDITVLTNTPNQTINKKDELNANFISSFYETTLL